MNERIKELAEQAGMTAMNRRSDGLYVVSEEVFAKFTDLIVWECIGVCTKQVAGAVGTYASAHNNAIGACIDNIKNRFGVE